MCCILLTSTIEDRVKKYVWPVTNSGFNICSCDAPAGGGRICCTPLGSPELCICPAFRHMRLKNCFCQFCLTDVALGKDLQQFTEHQGKRRHQARIFSFQTQYLQMQLRSAPFPSTRSCTLASSVLLETGKGLSQGNLHFKMKFFKAPEACSMSPKWGTNEVISNLMADREDSCAPCPSPCQVSSRIYLELILKRPIGNGFRAEF